MCGRPAHQPRRKGPHRLAAFDATTGEVTSWDPRPNGPVFSIVADGPTVYVGGQYTTIGGAPRSNLGAVSAAAGWHAHGLEHRRIILERVPTIGVVQRGVPEPGLLRRLKIP